MVVDCCLQQLYTTISFHCLHCTLFTGPDSDVEINLKTESKDFFHGRIKINAIHELFPQNILINDTSCHLNLIESKLIIALSSFLLSMVGFTANECPYRVFVRLVNFSVLECRYVFIC